jgi:hypothetical protein
MLKLNTNHRISCSLVSGSLTEMKSFKDRMTGCFQLVVQPWDMDLKDQLNRVFEENAGPHAKLDTLEVFGAGDTLILESVIKPYAPDFTETEKELLQKGTSLEVTIQPELKGEGEILFPQLTIVFVDPYFDADEHRSESYWENLDGPIYDF